jgi:putative membrane protein insertion efficiency factor
VLTVDCKSSTNAFTNLCTCGRAQNQPIAAKHRLLDMLKWLLILPIRIYRVTLSPLLGPNKCRFQPTCSAYAIEAIQEWGPLKGSWLATKRICSCHPWGRFGPDPVPKNTENRAQSAESS